MRARSLTCGQCGGRTRILHGESEAVCVHCGQPVRLSQALMEEQANAWAFPPTTPIRVGMTAQWEDREYEVWSRQVLRQVDDEGTTYQWEEFLLVAPDGDLFYLEYDEGKFKLSRPFTPQQVPDPNSLAAAAEGGTLAIDGRGCSVTDAGLYTVVYFEGEFPWTVSVNQQRRFVDLRSFGGFYSVEWSADAIEYYQGRYLDERQVYAMFGLRYLIDAYEKRARVLRGRRVFAWTCLAAALFCLSCWIVSFGGGRPVAGGTAQIAATGEEGRRFGPFPLTAKDRVYRLELRGQMRQQSNWVQAVLEDEKEAELFETNRDMWDESGSDSDGPWHESDLNSSTDFVINKPGNYYVRLYMEPEPGQASTGDATVNFSIRQGVLYGMYFLLVGLCLLVVGFIWLARGAASVQAHLWEKVPNPAEKAAGPAAG
jgi:hypothetical protein